MTELERVQGLLRQCSQQEKFLMAIEATWMLGDAYFNAKEIDNPVDHHACVIVPDPSVVLLVLRWYRGIHNVPADSWDQPPSSLDIFGLFGAWCGALKTHARSIGAGVYRLLVRTKHKTQLTFALRDASNWELSDVDLATSSHDYPLKLDQVSAQSSCACARANTHVLAGARAHGRRRREPGGAADL